MWWMCAVQFAAAQEPLRLAALEVGLVGGELSEHDGIQARAEWSTGRTVHFGVQGSWNGGGEDPEFSLYDPTPDHSAARHEIRALAAISAHLDDRHVQVGLGLAAGPWIFVGRDAYVSEPLTGELATFSGTDVVLSALWTSSVRVRIVKRVGVYFATTGDFVWARTDASFGIGWTR
jgi:hypothetical protein